MATYAVSLLDDPSAAADQDNPKVTPVVLLTADTPTSPITDVEPVEGASDSAHQLYVMADDAVREYEDATGKQMTPTQMVRFFGQSAMLTDGDEG